MLELVGTPENRFSRVAAHLPCEISWESSLGISPRLFPLVSLRRTCGSLLTTRSSRSSPDKTSSSESPSLSIGLQHNKVQPLYDTTRYSMNETRHEITNNVVSEQVRHKQS